MPLSSKYKPHKADLKQCECIKKMHNALQIGGQFREERCPNRPLWIAKQGKEEMGLCFECKEVFAEWNQGDKTITIKEIKR